MNCVNSQVSDVFQEKDVGITCYKHKFGVVGKGKNSRSSIDVRLLGLGPELAQINLQIAFMQHYIYLSTEYRKNIESQSMSLEYISQSGMFSTTVIFVTTLQSSWDSVRSYSSNLYSIIITIIV